MPRLLPILLLWLLFGVNETFAQSSFQKEYFATGSHSVLPYSLSQRPDGNFVVSHLVREDSLRLHVTCIGSNGEVLWSTQLHAHFAGDQANEGIKKTPIMVTSDNSCLVLVAKSLITTGQGWALVKLSADGQVQWTRYITGVGSVSDLLGYSNGRIYLQARYWSFDSRPYMACLDDNGNVIWEKNVQSHLDNVTATGMRILPDQRILVNLAESSFLQQSGHIARLGSDGTLTPLLSLPNLSIMASDEHPSDGRLYFMARTLDSISLKNFVLLGAAKNGQVQWMKVIGVPQDYYLSGALGFNAAYDSLIASFRPTYFEGQRYWIHFDLNGNPGSARYVPSAGIYENEVISTSDGGYAWLSANAVDGNVNSFVLAKTDSEVRLPDCPTGSLCGLTVRDTFFPTISVTDWSTLPVSNIITGTTTQSPRSLTAADFCNPLPIADAGIVASDSTGCGNEPIVFERLPGVTGFSRWFFSGGTPAFFTGAEPPGVVFSGTGLFQIRHILNQAGCLDTAQLLVRIAAYPEIVLPVDTVLCAGQSLLVDAAAAGGTDYIWNDGVIDAVREIEQPGIYALTVTNSEGCTSSTSMNVEAPKIPVALWSEQAFFCTQQAVVLHLTDSSGWQFNWTDGFAEPNRPVEVPGVFHIEALSPEHCILQDSVTVSERMPPEVHISLFPSNCGPQSLEVLGDGLTFFNWNTGDTTAAISAARSGWFSVTASDGFCSGSDSVQVEISACPECLVYIPNSFQPVSGTGNFVVQSPCVIERFHLQVYDRWGTLLFESMNAGTPWDGTRDGKALPAGVYVYRLEMDLFSGDAVYPFYKTGDVTIVR